MALGLDRAMASIAWVKRFVTALLLVTTSVACERSKREVPHSPPIIVSRHASPAVVSANAWDDTIGPVVAAPSPDNGAPALFSRDTASTADVQVELFNHTGHSIAATLRPIAHQDSCRWMRSAKLIPGRGVPDAPDWSLALAPTVAIPVALTGIGDLQPRDSASLAARVSALVSALPEDSASTPFRGLPIVVRDAWRFQVPGDSASVVVAVASRTLNVESNPLSEVVTVVAEPDASAGAPEWRATLVQRDAGAEDRVEGTDLLAALQLRNGHVAVALMNESDTGNQIEIIERTGPASWRRRWSTVAFSCSR
jgi:hypothetical protein